MLALELTAGIIIVMSELDQSHEAISAKPGRIRKLAGIMFLSVATTTLGGAVLGHLSSEYFQKLDRKNAAKEAAGYEQCIGVVKKNVLPGSSTAIVRLSDLSQKEQRDCGFSFDRHHLLDGQQVTNPLDSKVKSVDVVIQLPSIPALEQAVNDDTIQAESPINHFYVNVWTAASGILGLVAGSAVREQIKLARDRSESRRQI